MNFWQRKETEPSTSSTDPFNPIVFPEEIQGVILSYLPFADLLNSTLVSKLWNSEIGASGPFKKRVVLELHSWNQDPSPIANSNRLYEIISIADFELRTRKLDCLSDKNWRCVTLNIGSIRSQSKFVTIMKTFHTVRDLKILSTNIGQLSGNPKVVLPMLENLVLSDVTLDLFDMLIAKQPSMKSLSMRFVICDVKSPRRVGEALLEFLSLNENLKDLEMNHVVTNDFFSVKVAPLVNSKLKSLTIGLNETKPEVRENIEGFLQSQGDTVENLKLVLHQKFTRQESHQWQYWDVPAMGVDRSSDDINIIYNVWNLMTALTSLNIRFLQNSADLQDNQDTRAFMKTLKRNANITSLNIQFINVQAPASVVISLMKLTPNLHSIYVTKLTSAVVRYAAINLKALRSLKCFSFSEECQQEYTELKASRDDVNKFIVIKDRCALG